MKIISLVLFIAVAVFLFYPASPDSSLTKIKSSVFEKIGSVGKSKADYEEELRYKTEELAAYQQALEKLDADVKSWETNAPVCPTTGQKAIIRIDKDGRTEVREKIKKTEEEIAILKTKIQN